jgi:hypothetical protein
MFPFSRCVLLGKAEIFVSLAYVSSHQFFKYQVKVMFDYCSANKVGLIGLKGN